ncbi:hypothetical protein SAMN05421538_102198 [Paracoccus isoporae]|uniref:GAF domain-containing protein n=1 Tax=Paracoccus isoporae TaxID=591205 RepID=A0A1G6WSW3_9RHOB|nr:GAF domain-containing protein [Paracoccus isoporae]SDD68186.1 hypothetical protein SAMN05421538_102198 [Paracoccus isoporae]
MTDHQDAHGAFIRALSAATTETQVFDALCALARARVGAKLFTIMTVDMQAMLARRAYSDDPVNYPASGTKPITIDRWFEQVHGRHECFIANTLAEIATVFPDADLIGRLGCASVVNLPVIRAGELVATINMLHEEGYYTPARVETIREELTLPSMAAMALADGFEG